MRDKKLVVHHAPVMKGSPSALMIAAIVERLRENFAQVLVHNNSLAVTDEAHHLFVSGAAAADSNIIAQAEAVDGPILMLDLPLTTRHASAAANQANALSVTDIAGDRQDGRYSGGWADARQDALASVTAPAHKVCGKQIFALPHTAHILRQRQGYDQLNIVQLWTNNAETDEAANAPAHFIINAPESVISAVQDAQKHLARCGTKLEVCTRLVDPTIKPKGLIYIATADSCFDSSLISLAAIADIPLISTRDIMAEHKGRYWPIDNPNHPSEWTAALGALAQDLALGTAYRTDQQDASWNALVEAICSYPTAKLTHKRRETAVTPYSPSPLGSVLIGAAPGRLICSQIFKGFKPASSSFFLPRAAAEKLAKLLATPLSLLAPRLDFENYLPVGRADKCFERLAPMLRAVQRINLCAGDVLEASANLTFDVSLCDDDEVQKFPGGWRGRASERIFWRDYQGGCEFVVLAAGMAQVTVHHLKQSAAAAPDQHGIAHVHIPDSIALPLDKPAICRISMTPYSTSGHQHDG